MSENNSSSSIVAIVAIIVILGLGFLAFRAFGGADMGAPSGGPSINVDVPSGNGQ